MIRFIISVCPLLLDLREDASIVVTANYPYNVAPDPTCTTIGCTNTVTCTCPFAGHCFFDFLGSDGFPVFGVSTDAGDYGPVPVTCESDGSYSVSGIPFEVINCYDL